MQTHFTVGIEEEFQIVDPETRDLQSSVSEVLESGRELLQDQLKQEMFQAMVEVGTEICDDVTEARKEVIHLRRTVGEIVDTLGCRLVAAGTHPFAHWLRMDVTDDDRYISLTEQLQEIARSIAVFGLHVHVGVDDRDQSIELMNEVRYFLPHILALSEIGRAHV